MVKQALSRWSAIAMLDNDYTKKSAEYRDLLISD
jgi:hypothetical protein